MRASRLAIGTIVAVSLLAGVATFLYRRRFARAPVAIHTVTGESPILPRRPIPTAGRASLATSLRSIAVGGKERRYLILEPPAAPAPRALVLVFHGDGGDAVGFHQGWPFERASGDGAYVVYPEGIGRTWNLETLDDNPDEAYVLAIVDAVVAAAAIDKTRIFAAGYSSGGFLANVLACHRPGLFRAIASNAGGAPYNQREKWPNGFPKCPGQEPVAALALHGEQDFAVGLDSGRFSAEYWAYVNKCETGAMETTGYPECLLYRGCPSGKAVGFCSIAPLGHWVWSEAAEASWTFFQTAAAAPQMQPL